MTTIKSPASTVYKARIRFTNGAGWIDAHISAEDHEHLRDQELPTFTDTATGDLITFNWANTAAIQAEPITAAIE